MGQKKEEKVVDKFGNVEKIKKENKDEKEREILNQKLVQNKMKKNKGKLLEVREIPTYKILFKNFIKKFDEAIESMENNNEYLNEEEIRDLLHLMGMISSPNKNILKENDEENKEKIIITESPLENPIQQEENRLINLFMNNFKNEENQINKEDFKNFLICVVGLQKYYFYYLYKSQHDKEISEEFKCKKEDIPELIIKKEKES